MKRNRIIYAILWILSLIGISFFGGTVSYGIFYALTFLPVILFLYLIFVWIFFHIYQQIGNKRLIAGRMEPFYFTLMNEYHFGFCSIRVHFFSSFSDISGLDDDTEYELLPGTGIKKNTQLVCKYRGEYEVGIKNVEITDFLRLFKLRYHNKETQRVYVRPDIVDLSEIKSLDLSQTLFKNSFVNPIEPDILVRKYEAGDDIRMINWKASARSGELLVRKMTAQEREGVSILLGSKRISEEMADYLPLENKMLELAIALAYFFVRKNITVHTYYLDGELQEANTEGIDSFEGYYERMSALAFKTDSDEEKMLVSACGQKDIFTRRSAFLILHEWTAAAAETVKMLRENNVFVMVCIVNDDNIEINEDTNNGVKMIRIGTEEDLKEADL